MAALVVMLAVTTGNTHARIAFENSDTLPVNSSGITLDNDNDGTTDINLQFGNDGTDGIITFDISANDLIIEAPNTTTIKDGGYNVLSVEDATTPWGSAGATSLNYYSNLVYEHAVLAADPNCDTISYNIGDRYVRDDGAGSRVLYECTVTGTPGTWIPVDTTLYMWQDLFVTNGEFSIETPNWQIDSSNASANFDGVISAGDFKLGTILLSSNSTVSGASAIGIDNSITYTNFTEGTTIQSALEGIDIALGLAKDEQDFENVYATDADNTLSVADNNGAAFAIGNAGTGPDMITFGTLDENETVIFGVKIAGASWNITSAGAATFTSVTDGTAILGELGTGTFSSTNYVTDNDFTASIGALDAQIFTNTGNITTNTSSISTNATGISDLESAVGTTGDVSSITYSATNYVANATSTITAIGALDAQVKANADSALANSDNNDVLILNAEYPNTSFANGGAGILEAGLYDATEGGYYEWYAASTSETIDIVTEVTVPADAASIDSFSIRGYLANTTDNDISVSIHDGTTPNCASATDDNVTAASWQTITTASFGGCSFVAGDTMVVTTTLTSNNNNSAQIAEMSFTYSN